MIKLDEILAPPYLDYYKIQQYIWYFYRIINVVVPDKLYSRSFRGLWFNPSYIQVL